MTKTQQQTEFEAQLSSDREKILSNIQKKFQDKAIEGHLSGSLARGNPDAFSDIDIWFTLTEENTAEILENRFKYYAEIGEILHICEPPQNAPIDGVHSALLIKTSECITVVDLYLCPLSTAYIPSEGKKLFGIDLPFGSIGYNPKKVTVNNDYRVDFFICFIFNTIKKIVRNAEKPLEAVLLQYEYLSKNYQIPIEPLNNQGHDFFTLKQIVENTKKIANEKQRKILIVISDFIKKVETVLKT